MFWYVSLFLFWCVVLVFMLDSNVVFFVSFWDGFLRCFGFVELACGFRVFL